RGVQRALNSRPPPTPTLPHKGGGNRLCCDGTQKLDSPLAKLSPHGSDGDDQLAGIGHAAPVVLEQHRGGAVLLNECRSRDLCAGAQVLAAIDLGDERLAGGGEIRRVFGGRRGGAARRQAWEVELGALADGAEP